MGNTNGKSAETTTQPPFDLGTELRERADNLRLDAIKNLHNFAAKIREEVGSSEKVDADSKEKADEFASRLEKAAEYLNERTVEDLETAATTAVQKNVWRNLLVVFVLGFIIGILIKRSQ